MYHIYIYIALILYVIDAKDRNLYPDINYILFLMPQNNSRYTCILLYILSYINELTFSETSVQL